MKIGIFDSGLGGLVVLSGLLDDKFLAKYDYIFLGDTKNLPYGDKTQQQIYNLTVKAVEYLFKQNCELVIVACNTASSQALRKVQQDWLPKSRYKTRKVLGIIRPTVEEIGNIKKLGIIGTRRTIDSKAYLREIAKIRPKIKIVQVSAPKLVPMIESGQTNQKILADYFRPFKNVDAVVLACTHYGLVKQQIRKILGPKIKILAQEDLLPKKLKSYLIRHGEITSKLSQKNRVRLLVTKLSPAYQGNFKTVKY